MAAKFITFEGIEGCGKSTQAKKLQQFFLAKNQEAILTREPGGTKAGELIRQVLLSEEIDKLAAKTELFLNFAARIEHVEKLIKPALQQQKIVISDRFFDSTYAYQGSAFGLDFALVDEVKKSAIGEFQPDVTFFIDIPIELAFSRIEGRLGNNRYEKLSRDFHEKVRQGFLLLAQKNSRIRVIDGNRSIEEVFAEISTFI